MTHHQETSKGLRASPAQTWMEGSVLQWTAFSLISLIAMMLLALPVHGQTTFGSVLGTLNDPSGAVVPNTTVTLVNVATSTKTETTSDASGYYQFFNVPPGNYKLVVKKQGFKQLSQGPFEVQVEASLRINLALQVGSEDTTVTVTATSPLIQAETTNLGAVVDTRQTTELPLNGRNPMNLTALVPSVVPQGQSNGNTNSANPFAWGNYQIGGGMANQSGTYIDGSPVNTSYINLTALVPTQDSLAEFKVDTNNLPPEYGHLAGGAIQFSTKSGTNSLHGAFWEYLRNKVLDANSWWNNYYDTPRGPFTQNQFGFNVGGPIVIPHVYNGKNKTFFFFDYEGFYNRQGATYTQTVPTPDQIAGDLSTLALVTQKDGSKKVPQIYDPNSTCLTLPCDTVHYPDEVNLYDRHAIPNNNLLAYETDPSNVGGKTQISPVAQKYIQTFYPVSKVNATFPANGQTNYSQNASIGGQNFEYVAKIDHAVSDKQHISSRYTYWKNTNLPFDVMGTGICQDRCNEDFKVHNWVFNDTYVFSNTTILDMRLSYLRFVYGRTVLDSSYTPADIGQTLGNGTSPKFPGPMMISIGGYDTSNTFGSGGADSVIANASDNDRIAGTLTKIIGKHTFKFGGEYQRATFNYAQSNNSGGQGSVDTSFTEQNHFNGAPGTGAALASFLLGIPGTVGYNTPNFVTSELLYSGIFGNDDWRLTSKLTAHLGLRWEKAVPWTDRFNEISYFDAGQTNPILAANSAAILAADTTGLLGGKLPAGSSEVVDSSTRSSRHPFNPFNKAISPRVGFNYALTPSTVVSGGYGILWVPLEVGFSSSPNNDPINSYTTNTVNSINGSETPAATWDFANPLPGGIIPPPGRSTDPVHGFQYVLLGTGVTENWPDNPYAYAQQWNMSVQKQLGSSLAVNVAYAGAKGTHLPFYSLSKSALPDSYLSADADTISHLGDSVANPFYGVINPTYGLGAQTVTRSHLLSPYPQYNGVSIASADWADSTYHSLQVTVNKRFSGGAQIGAAYTYAKLISSTDTLTGWLEPSSADNWGVSDPNNLALEKALSSNDVRNRLVINYVYDIPVGRGKALLPNVSRLADTIVGGWGIEGITTFQTGWPIPFGESTNTNNPFGFGQRPTVVAGCDRKSRPSGQKIWQAAFNTSCFEQTARGQFGEPRNDAVVKGPGIDNWDTSIFKNVSITNDGRASFQFRAEFFNIWNRTQFGIPNATLNSAAFGTINSQLNLPRLVQFGMRIKY